MRRARRNPNGYLLNDKPQNLRVGQKVTTDYPPGTGHESSKALIRTIVSLVVDEGYGSGRRVQLRPMPNRAKWIDSAWAVPL